MFLVVNSTNINDRPIIGIFSQPTSGKKSVYGPQYIAASYVKFIESGGARVIPILYDSPINVLEEQLNSINGILLPGGGLYYDQEPEYVKALQFVWELSLSFNKKGDYFPIWGTCFGMEEIIIMTTGNFSILSHYDPQPFTAPLNFTQEAQKSRLFGTAPGIVIDSFSTLPITANAHQWALDPMIFLQTEALYSSFNVLSYNYDLNGKLFISTIESKDYPIYGVQWHPEKPIFEWKNTINTVSHSFEGIIANQYTSNFFVNECRKNFNNFTDKNLEQNSLIYNFNPIMTFNISTFEQCYIFPSSSSTTK
eukprot:gene8584-10562_t